MKSFYLTLICLLLFNVSNGQKMNYGNNPKAAKYYHIRGINPTPSNTAKEARWF